MSDKSSFFEKLQTKQMTAVLLHRDEFNKPVRLTVPPDFLPADVTNCLRSFGYEAEIGDIQDFEDALMGDYTTVELVNVREYVPAELSLPAKVVKQGLERAARLFEGFARKLT